MEWVVTETPSDPSLTPLWVGEAADALRALDAFADQEGFALYSDLVDPRQHESFRFDAEGGWIGQTNDGRVWAVFTNMTIWALPVGSEEMRAVASAIGRAKREICEDIERGVVPATVASFSELHDYVDANEYGGLCDDNAEFDVDHANAVQDAVDGWIKGGGARKEWAK